MFASPEAAWKKREKLVAERELRRLPARSGWWVVQGPGYEVSMGVGEQLGKPRPKFTKTPRTG